MDEEHAVDLEPIRVRVVFARERAGLAWATALVGGVIAGSMLTFSSPDAFQLARHVCIGGMILWLGGPLLVHRARPRTTTASGYTGGLVLGRVGAAMMGSAVSIARARRGWSVAIDSERGLIFLEVERARDALRIARALGVSNEESGQGTLTWRAGHRALTLLTRAVGALGLFSAFGYVLTLGASSNSNASWILGTALAAAVVNSALFIASRALARAAEWGATGVDRTAVAGSGAVERHVRLHASAPDALARTAASVIDDDLRDDGLAQQAETTAAWIARVDALDEGPHEGHYRAHRIGADALRRLAADETQPPDARLGAARVLALRYQEPAARLRVSVGDLAPALPAVLEADGETAARRLDAARPLFRAE